MFRKIVMSLVVGACLVGTASAFTIFTNGVGDNDWSNAGNWHNGLPTAYQGYVRSPSVGPAVVSGTADEAVALFLVVNQGFEAGTSEVQIKDSAKLTVNGNIFMGNGALAGANGKISLSDSASLTCTGFIDMGQFPSSGDNSVYASGSATIDLPNNAFFIGNNAGATGTLDLSGDVIASATGAVVGQQGTGTLNVSGNAQLLLSTDFLIGNFIAAAVGEANVSGGLVTAPYMTVGGIGKGTLNMTAGSIDLAGACTVADGDNFGHIQLDGGMITAAELDLSTVGTMQLTGGGRMILEGTDWTVEMEDYQLSGQLQNAVVSFDGTDTILTAIPEPASLVLIGLGACGLLRRKKA